MNNEIGILPKESYPETLQNIKNPPDTLYMRGTLPKTKNHKFLCVVGSRHPSPYGQEACRKLISGLRGYPISIVSGLAIGIDSYSHKIALENGLNCIGFPGSSLEWDGIYPPSSTPLARRIISSGGCLLSEYGPDYVYVKWAFPSRNRYMAGISHATLVIEAKKRSGSLITTKCAEDYGRDVLAVPGSIFSDLSYGPHMLLGGCANPATCSEDILNVLGFDVKGRSLSDNPAFKRLDPISKKIALEIAHGETTADDICEYLSIGISELNERLSMLELEGLIKIYGGSLRIA